MNGHFVSRYDLTGRTERRVKGWSEQRKTELRCLKRDKNFTFYEKSEKKGKGAGNGTDNRV